MKRLELIELICRVAFILKMKLKDFLKDVLARVLVEKHKEIWKTTPDIEERIHTLLPKNMELPAYKELQKLAPEVPFAPPRGANDVHQASGSAGVHHFSIGASPTSPSKPSAATPQDHLNPP